MTYNTKKSRKTNKDIGYSNSSRRIRPMGSRVTVLAMECEALALLTESGGGGGGGEVLGYNIGPKDPTLEPNLLCFSRGSRFFVSFNLSHQLFVPPLL